MMLIRLSEGINKDSITVAILKEDNATEKEITYLAQAEIFSDLLRKHENEQVFFTPEQWGEITAIAKVMIEELVTAIFNSRMPPYLRDRRN